MKPCDAVVFFKWPLRFFEKQSGRRSLYEDFWRGCCNTRRSLL
jgi:hypothetical protein